MARVSFTLQKTDSLKGSYLRYDETIGARTDYDSALKADGFQLAPTTFTSSFFQADSVCYGEVNLRWGVTVNTPTSTPTVTGIVVVYSPEGEPQTIAGGQILVESSTTFTYQQVGVPQGKWAYYSLFVHYTSTAGDDYYERAASLRELLSKNYGSTLLLWNRIPEFYRNQDLSIATSQANNGTYVPSPCAAPGLVVEPVGPLFKFLSIIGYDMDRMRTILDYTMTSKDPVLASSETLDALADEMGVTMGTADLGAARLRSVLNDIGYFRRSKGTPASIEAYGQAIDGGDVEINQDTRSIKVYSQRVNYITSPKVGTGIVQSRSASVVEETAPLAFSATTYSSPVTYTQTGTAYTANGVSPTTHVMFRILAPIPVRRGDSVDFSVQSGVGTEAIKWVRLIDSNETVVGFSNNKKRADGAPAFQVDFKP